MGYRFLIPFIVVGLLLHILIQTHHHLQRRKTPSDAGHTEQTQESGTVGLPASVVRFSAMSRVEHLLVIVLFGMLVLTGIPQGYPRYTLASEMVEFWGGIASIRLVHRTCGFGFAALLVIHILRGVVWTIRSHRRPDILPTFSDFKDALESLRHYLGRGPAPRFGNFDCGEKFEYCGILLGGCLIAVTGLLLIFPEFAATYLPGVILTAARVAHGYEATLALLVVLVWHVWGVGLRPEVFPCDTSIFTGRISLERLREEHGLEYEKLLGAHRRGASRNEPRPATAPTPESSLVSGP
jgi:cytochrome b subunit of formate dehydrogenase